MSMQDDLSGLADKVTGHVGELQVALTADGIDPIVALACLTEGTALALQTAMNEAMGDGDGETVRVLLALAAFIPECTAVVQFAYTQSTQG